MDTQSQNTTVEGRPYKLGVALSGGGARGFAHAGALMAIEEAGFKPDVIAGVSAGSIAAVLYSAGVKPLEMANLFSKANMRDFAELSFGAGGLFRIDKFQKFIYNAIAPIRRIEELHIPTFIGVTDLDHGVPAVFDHGEIGPRMVASCSIPIVFKPMEIDGVHYVDGGVLRNHPAWIIRDKCRFLIGVNVSPLGSDGRYRNLIDVALRTYNLMAKANQSADMAMCDLSIETPEIAHYAVFNLKNIKNIFMSGYIHTRRMLRNAGMWNPQGPAPQVPNINKP